MNTWAPLFSKIVDSSIWIEEDFVVKIFLTMLAKKDSDQVVRGTAFNIAQWAKKTEREALDALRILSAPDTKRLEPQPFDGRRVEKVEGGWLILNGRYYEEMMRSANRREYKKLKQREYRSRASSWGPTQAERLMDNGDEHQALRTEEIQSGVQPGTLGSYGSEVQEAVTKPKKQRGGRREGSGRRRKTDEEVLEAARASNDPVIKRALEVAERVDAELAAAPDEPPIENQVAEPGEMVGDSMPEDEPLDPDAEPGEPIPEL